ncbi:MULTISPECIES: EF-hand domain-containing protein [unclassified Mesorhizobium]|uniref:EF-hand domain-containing protein n=1 Tax=unclassified Mesorhizobium TaxID=325217 RepID=UPI001CCAB97C|nr:MULTISPECIES: EF-hand domain-containing protein [unclassified Mesorhizobium]MBZ9683552.1 EF-hand domain-containing protein [Mesorhizobium sp. CO1-1-2]MBZ9698545.1 EF-hand domain-containing protein [Mesorhizobium sp. CO1-1-9]MBZ9928079.1 EF-hand domain-containing protein [Mesorhizobium sp. BR1-1-4]
MNKIVMALAGVLLCTASACAADGSARDLFRRIDTNGDRKLEFSEIQEVRAAMFDRMDTNHNGVLDAEEVRTAVERVKSTRDFQTARFAGFQTQAGRIDRNGDGKISRDEFAAFIPDRLLKADTNGDGALSISELRTLRRQ